MSNNETHREQCSVCDGSGSEAIPFGIMKCSGCHGTGLVARSLIERLEEELQWLRAVIANNKKLNAAMSVMPPYDEIEECIGNFFDNYEHTGAYKQMQGLLSKITELQELVTLWETGEVKRNIPTAKETT